MNEYGTMKLIETLPYQSLYNIDSEILSHLSYHPLSSFILYQQILPRLPHIDILAFLTMLFLESAQFRRAVFCEFNFKN